MEMLKEYVRKGFKKRYKAIEEINENVDNCDAADCFGCNECESIDVPIKTEPIGVLLASKDREGNVFIGASFCDTRYDEFDKKEAMIRAMVQDINGIEIPHYAHFQVEKFIERVNRYYKINY